MSFHPPSQPSLGILVFGVGEKEKSIELLVEDDLASEGDENFYLELYDARGSLRTNHLTY